jgi:carbonic anhydrase
MTQSRPLRGSVTADPCHWSYYGSTNPWTWGTLAQNGGRLCFPLCADSDTAQQSPIDIETNAIIVDPTLPALGVSYSSITVNVTDGHNNFTAHYPAGTHNKLIYRGTTYNLDSFHFHHPAEHQANGVTIGPIELHLVHTAETPPQTQLLVLTVFMAILSANTDDGKILAELVDNVGQSIDVDATKFLPNERRYLTYQGSLTTPPCTERVIWLLVDTAMPVHMNNVLKFKSGLGRRYNYSYNARGVQQLNGRTVHSSPGPASGGFIASLGRT